MIRLENITVRFGNSNAIDRLSLTIPDGETTVLLGPSGSGKSTLIRTLNGLIFPNAGSVYIDETPLTSSNVLSFRRQMGYVIQQGGLFPHLNARQNVSLIAEYIGWTKDQINSKIRSLTRLTNFPEDGLNRYPAQLSGGQNQRVSIMRALMLDPPILLLDEPLTALDPIIRFDLQRDLKEIFAGMRKTVVLVTHDISEAAYFSNRIVLINRGTIVQSGSIRELAEHPAEPFVARFIQAQRPLILSPEREKS